MHAAATAPIISERDALMLGTWHRRSRARFADSSGRWFRAARVGHLGQLHPRRANGREDHCTTGFFVISSPKSEPQGDLVRGMMFMFFLARLLGHLLGEVQHQQIRYE